MANQEQLNILKMGVDTWNKWRIENFNNETQQITRMFKETDFKTKRDLYPSFSDIDLRDADLHKMNLRNVNFRNVNLSGADLGGTNLAGADFGQNSFVFQMPHLKIEMGAYIRTSFLLSTDLSNAILEEANLRGAKFVDVKMQNTNMYKAIFGETLLANVNLIDTYGLDETLHVSPSTIGVDTIQLSMGKIPVRFLMGCGLRDADIEFVKLSNPDLSNEDIVNIQYRIFDFLATQAVQISPLFISYSHADTGFVDALEKGLNSKGIRFWRDIHNLTAGRIETQLDRAIQQNPTVVVVLSKNSLDSDWVQHEVRKARELEKELGRDTLCPIALDDSWKTARWPQRIMEQIMEYNILDFSQWQQSDLFDIQFSKLLQGLDIFYKKPE